MAKERRLRFDTLCVRAGQEPDPATGASAVPIYQTASYVFRNAEHAAAVFEDKEKGNIYTRIMNPTTDVFEKRMAALEGGCGALATASGQAAEFIAVTTIAGAGDEIVSSASLYGGTYVLFNTTLVQFGIKPTFVDSGDLEAYRKAIRPRTRAVYIETIGNPRLNVPDIEAVAGIAHEAGIPLIIDNTFASPYLCRPFEHGADVVIHSTTKYIGGHGNSIGGAIVDSGKFNWDNGRFPELVDANPAIHGKSYREIYGEQVYIGKARAHLMRDIGPCQSPFNSFLFLQGLETLALRVERHSSNAMKVAQFLSSHPAVSWVTYPGLPENPWHKNACKYLHGGFGGMIVFGIKGGLYAGQRLMDNLELFTMLANLGDTKSLIIHPASTTHHQLTAEQQIVTGVTPDMVRMSVGIEDPDDLIEDLDQALAKATSGI